MKRALLPLALVTLAGTAIAQPLPSLDKLNAVRVGLFLPGSGDARDLGATWLALGADFDMTKLFKFGPLENKIMLSADYMEKLGARSIPIALTYRWSFVGFYAFAGAGVAFNRAPGGIDSAKFGLEFGAGIPFGIGPVPTFVEAKLFTGSESALRGVGLFVGVKF
ncbi:MAG: hypothetical protein KIS66_02975 [Fimbriimonadaceae bacterium]|nr:hypothetical protein [Fimbriimonadaceae bacterium]